MIAWALRTTDLVLIVSLLVCASEALRLAPRVYQNLEGRSTYEGGWPLAASSCPVEASVACFTGDGINPTCCPSGQTCFGSTAPYCCPTETDCASEVNNLPVCANSTWDMYGQDDNGKFFCCESGQLAVDPISGYTGICEDAGQVVPVSLRATMVSQIGGTPVPPYGSYVTGAVVSGSNSPATTTAASGTATVTKVTGTTKILFSATATGTSPAVAAAVTSAIKLSLGAIIGIAVGGCLVILAILSIAIWCCCCRGRRRRPAKEAYEPYTSTAYASPPQQMYGGPPPPQQTYSPMPMTYQNAPYAPSGERGLSPGTEYKVASPHVAQTEVLDRPSTHGRVEM